MVDWTLVSGCAAAVTIPISIAALWTAHRSQKRMGRIAARSWSDDYFRDVATWACEVTRSISTALRLVGVEDESARRDTLIVLSACIDMGRWYFPNKAHDSRGLHKEPAYRGVRQPVLDWVVLAYDVCSGRKSSDDPRDLLVHCQRQFVSAIQETLDPRSRSEEIRRILDDFSEVSALPRVQSPR